MSDAHDLIRLANSEVSITRAFQMIGEHVGYAATASMKIYCPFGDVAHMDAGHSKSMRVYPQTNSAWCFAGCGYFDPVRLVADYRDLTKEAAAEAMLAEIGYVRPDYFDQWEVLTSERPKVDTAALAEALKMACSRFHPKWESLQFNDRVSKSLAKCLSLLTKVRSEEDAQKWLTASKDFMQKVLAG